MHSTQPLAPPVVLSPPLFKDSTQAILVCLRLLAMHRDIKLIFQNLPRGRFF
uniref:Uncharacterized protein n=1 Tax=Pseudomonas putida (strain ATCC 700007 / DSM 6899 / JCM 31910 / BCRC 17059 / LMG 24140 / F1) TaxID=351746 RepID=A5VXX9_PSEP1